MIWSKEPTEKKRKSQCGKKQEIKHKKGNLCKRIMISYHVDKGGWLQSAKELPHSYIHSGFKSRRLSYSHIIFLCWLLSGYFCFCCFQNGLNNLTSPKSLWLLLSLSGSSVLYSCSLNLSRGHFPVYLFLVASTPSPFGVSINTTSSTAEKNCVCLDQSCFQAFCTSLLYSHD